MIGHLKYISRERATYAQHRELAAIKNGTRQALSVGMDATASFSTMMPIPHRCLKDPASLREKVKVTMCVIHHYRNEPSHCLRLATPPWIPATGSQQIHLIIIEVLPYMLEEYVRQKRTQPKTLYIQTDRGIDMWQASYHPMWSWLCEQGGVFVVWFGLLFCFFNNHNHNHNNDVVIVIKIVTEK